MKACIIGVLLSACIMSGCAKDYSLAPPANSESLTVTLKVPPGLIPKNFEAMYRSGVCKRLARGGTGQRIELEGYHGVTLPLMRQGLSDLYKVTLPKDGGGRCEWHLANITFGVAYPESNSFGEGVLHGTGGGVVVKFDNNRASRDGPTEEVSGDLIIRKDYYPWIFESFVGGYRKSVNILGEGSIYLIYKAPRAAAIYFESVLHSSYVVHSIGPKVQKFGDYPDVLYPDGSFEPDRPWQPSFSKLQAIRLKLEGKQ